MAQRTQIDAHRLDAVADRGSVFLVEDKKIYHCGFAGVAVLGREQFLFGSDADQRLPGIDIARWDFEQQMVVDVDQARAPLRAFEIARRPEQ